MKFDICVISFFIIFFKK